MLEGLHDVDWAAVEHAYGDASDVPALIEALNSGDEESAKKAKYELFGNIYHQGTVYSATSVAVPFLIELLGDESRADKSWVLFYLTQLSFGSSYLHVHQIYYDEEEVQSDEFQERMRKELDDVGATCAAVAQGYPVYLRCLCDADPDVRASAGIALSGSGVKSSEIYRALLESGQSDESEVVRSTNWHAAGRCASDKEMAAFLQSAIAAFNDETPYVKWNIARSVVELSREPQPEFVEFLMAQMASGDLDGIHELAPFTDEIESATFQLLLHPNQKPHAERYVPIVQARMDEASGYVALELVDVVLNLAFDGPVAEGASFVELTDLQQSVLSHLVDCDPAWTFDGNVASMLRVLNLPPSVDELRNYVAPNPSDDSIGRRISKRFKK